MKRTAGNAQKGGAKKSASTTSRTGSSRTGSSGAGGARTGGARTGGRAAARQTEPGKRPAKKRSSSSNRSGSAKPASQGANSYRPKSQRPSTSRPASGRSGGSQQQVASPRPDGPIRLQKFLASCGLGSRRACEELIIEGRVTIDGKVAELGATVDPKSQRIHFDGQHLRPEPRRYYLLNKPRGVLCTNSDPSGRERVIDLFPEDSPRLFPVGRLDEDSEGLLIVTNDGDFSHMLAHPRHRIYRTYLVQVAGDPPRETLDQLKKGFFFSEGKFKVHDVKPIKKQGQSTFLEVTLTEGQNREIRRLMARIGHKVMTLQRTAFGPIQLGRVKVGKYRMLRDDEIQKLEAIVSRNLASGGSPQTQR